MATLSQASWKTAKKYSYLVMFIIPMVFAWMLYMGGAYLYFGAFFAWVIVPIADYWIGDDKTNYTPTEEELINSDQYYDLVVRLAVPIYLLTAIASFVYASRQNLAGWEILGLGWSLGSYAGLMMNAGHELGHRHNRFDKWLAKLYLHTVGYGHFTNEHNRGHHAHVSTPLDPSSAPKGMSLYTFLKGAVNGSIRVAWELEVARLERLGLSKWHWKNEMWRNALYPLLIMLVIALFLGSAAVAVFILQAVGGILTLEVVNYIEHYGLRRKQLENGRYERTSPLHSWNNNHLLTNAFFYQIQRHSDHHAWPSRKYQSLRHFDVSPQLPLGYPTMMILAWFPSQWFKIMDPLVDHFQAQTVDVDNQMFFGEASPQT